MKFIFFFLGRHKKIYIYSTVWVAWMIEMYCLMIMEAGSVESPSQLYYSEGFKVSAALASSEASLRGLRVAVSTWSSLCAFLCPDPFFL